MDRNGNKSMVNIFIKWKGEGEENGRWYGNKKGRWKGIICRDWS